MGNHEEIWVRFNTSEELVTKENEMYKVIGKYPGDCAIVIYVTEPKSIKRLSSNWNVRKECFSALENLLGKENVKAVERNMSEPQYELDPLERIADALEGINDSLSGMQQSLEVLETLTECISRTKYGNMICITGSVDTRNY